MIPLARKSNNPGGPYRKPRVDIYTMLLLFTLIAIIVGCVALYKEVADYGDTPLSARPGGTLVTELDGTPSCLARLDLAGGATNGLPTRIHG